MQSVRVKNEMLAIPGAQGEIVRDDLVWIILMGWGWGS